MAFRVLYNATSVLLLVFLCRELLQWFFSGSAYLRKEKDNWLEATLIVLSFVYLASVMAVPALSAHSGAAAVFLAWLNTTLLMGR